MHELTHTDAQGRYVFEAVEPGSGWNLTTGIFENGASGLSRTGLTLGPDGLEVNFETKAGSGTVTGTITYQGKPVVGATVSAWDARGTGASVSTTTDVPD